MAAMNMVSAGGFSGFAGSKLSFKKMSAGGRLCTLQENAHFWVTRVKVRPPEGMFGTSEKRESRNANMHRDIPTEFQLWDAFEQSSAKARFIN
jgi:hypothetical protein